MSELLELAERCKKATGPDRELDAEIAKSLGWPNVRYYSANGGIFSKENDEMRPVPEWTASIDAALTLVPEGWAVLLAFSEQRSVCDVHTNPLGQEGTWPAHSTAATPALALCAAALKARHHTGAEDGR